MKDESSREMSEADQMSNEALIKALLSLSSNCLYCNFSGFLYSWRATLVTQDIWTFQWFLHCCL